MSPSGDDVRRQLDRLLASAVFANAGRMSRFLKFVVERTLAGEGERLKEYVIGVEVFDRDASYDPRLDSIVRVEAARLRSKLAEYYAGEGRADAVVLSLPKGGYAPIVTLEQRPVAASGAPPTNGTSALPPGQTTEAARRTQARWRNWTPAVLLVAGVAIAAWIWIPDLLPVGPVGPLRIAVLPFTPDGDDADTAALAQRITEGVTAELVRAGRFGVVASSAARAEYAVTRRPRDVAAALNADAVVEARLSVDGQLVRVEARAANGDTEEKLWVQSFAADVADTDALEREIASALSAAFSYAKLVDETGSQ